MRNGNRVKHIFHVNSDGMKKTGAAGGKPTALVFLSSSSKKTPTSKVGDELRLYLLDRAS